MENMEYPYELDLLLVDNKAAAKTEVMWMNINKKISCNSSKIGIALCNASAFLYLDLEFKIGFITASFYGLNFGIEVPRFQKPSIGLQGIDLSYISSVFSIGGGLLRRDDQEYAGQVMLSIAKWTNGYRHLSKRQRYGTLFCDSQSAFSFRWYAKFLCE